MLFWVACLLYGFLSSKGKFGLGCLDPPSTQSVDATIEWYMILTVFAFSFGEVFAGLLGGLFVEALGIAVQRVFGRLRHKTS